MKYRFFFSVMSVVSGMYAADVVLNTDEINKKLINLVVGNNIVGYTTIEDGGNLHEVQEFIQQHKAQVNFNYATDESTVIGGFSGSYTALQFACFSERCSHLVVKLLCEHGAQPVKAGGERYPATYCFTTICSLYEQYGQYKPNHALYCNQLKKLRYLKEYAQEVPLGVDTHDIPRALQDLKFGFECNNDKAGYVALIKGTVLTENKN